MRLLKIYIVLAGHFPFRETSENLHCSCRTFPIPWDFWKFTLFLQDISHSVRLLKIYIVLAGHFPFRETSENLHCSCRTFPIPWDFWKFTLFLQDISHSVRLLKIYIVLAGHFPFHETSDKWPVPPGWSHWHHSVLQTSARHQHSCLRTCTVPWTSSIIPASGSSMNSIFGL